MADEYNGDDEAVINLERKVRFLCHLLDGPVISILFYRHLILPLVYDNAEVDLW